MTNQSGSIAKTISWMNVSKSKSSKKNWYLKEKTKSLNKENEPLTYLENQKDNKIQQFETNKQFLEKALNKRDEEINNYKIKILHLKTINKTLNNKNENLKKLNNNFNKINNKNILQSSDTIKNDNVKKQTIEPIPKNPATTSNPESNISKEWFNIQPTIVKFTHRKARAYLDTQIGDVELEKDIINASNKVVIDISSEKVAKESKKEALKEIQKSTTSDTTKNIISTQKIDDSFEIAKKITISSILPFLTSYIADKSETNCADNYNKAGEHIRSQLDDDNLEKELLKISKQYVIDSVTRKIVKQKEERTLRIRKFVYDKETKEASIFVFERRNQC
ncbi:hypothetical protein C1645_839370 [Glomus cerebriforme]|uniref:Uncharacterized protein n=1 Tax=Glomus cerebriforme TaxID=658196 RepID=A0A397S5N6_9GLOM|nr:hypothetical protein C1645_839370 [Glomus cerebriforme]